MNIYHRLQNYQSEREREVNEKMFNVQYLTQIDGLLLLLKRLHGELHDGIDNVRVLVLERFDRLRSCHTRLVHH